MTLKKKLASKYDAKKAEYAIQWLEILCEEKFTEGNIYASLRNGQRLCKAINRIRPGSVKKINNSRMPFQERENIANYLRACVEFFGMKPLDMFMTGDLYDGTNLVVVIDNVYNLSKIAAKMGFGGPFLTPEGITHVPPSSPAPMISSLSPSSLPLSGQKLKPGEVLPSYFSPSPRVSVSISDSPVVLGGPPPALFAGPGPKYCPLCGTPRQGAGKYCGACGYKF